MVGLGWARGANALVTVGLAAGLALAWPIGARAQDADATQTVPSVLPLQLASLPPRAALEDSERRAAEPFGLETSPVIGGGLLDKWNGVRRKLPRERRILARCRQGAACPPAARRFLAVIESARAQEGLERIAEVNRSVNLAIRPVDDMTQYGVPDLWASPLMTFQSNAGDCEDYAIAKYVALQELGFSEQDLRLVVVDLRATGEDHAVTAVRHDGRWLILDNLTPQMLEDVDVAELDPLFVLDRDGARRLMTAPTRPPAIDNVAAISSRMPDQMRARWRTRGAWVTVRTDGAEADAIRTRCGPDTSSP